MKADMPSWLQPDVWTERAAACTEGEVVSALSADAAGLREFCALISPAAAPRLEDAARRAQALTRRHFGKTVRLYAPLYLSNFCPGGCAYCGFASDREQPRYRLDDQAVGRELDAMVELGFQDVLLLTGERCPEADFEYLRHAVALAADKVHNVSVETFALTDEEYAQLVKAGCTGVTLYQETYDPELYLRLHRWGPKRDYAFRIEAPDRALRNGIRMMGVGALLGLRDPLTEMIALFQHVDYLRRTYWRSGVMVSFPRLCPQRGDFVSPAAVGDRQLAQIVFAFRICFPDLSLVLSTRERPGFRDGMAGVGINRMSTASRTTVGGYAPEEHETGGQFTVNDTRTAETFCAMLRGKGLEPVFKNWDAVYRDAAD